MIYHMNKKPRYVCAISQLFSGIGGLTACLALLRRGIDVEVLSNPGFKVAGAGIESSPNGRGVLDTLDLTAFEHVRVEAGRDELRHWKTVETLDLFGLGATLGPALWRSTWMMPAETARILSKPFEI